MHIILWYNIRNKEKTPNKKGRTKMTVNTINGKITANKDALNSISIAFLEAAKKYKDYGADALAGRYDRVSEEIYNALKGIGYYN